MDEYEIRILHMGRAPGRRETAPVHIGSLAVGKRKIVEKCSNVPIDLLSQFFSHETQGLDPEPDEAQVSLYSRWLERHTCIERMLDIHERDRARMEFSLELWDKKVTDH